MSARILVIEDNPTNLQLMTYLLNAFGHATVTATDGEQGLEAARREVPDLILCDVDLPKLDGYEVARQLKGDDRMRSIPLIAVTALAMVGDRDEIMAAGFDGYIPKPIVPETFVGQIEAFIDPDMHTSSPVKTSTAPSPPKPEKHATILVVDDMPVNIDVARGILEPFGYRVISAPGAQEGLAAAQESPPDLILTDLHMPEESGFDFILKIKADPRLRHIPIILTSSSLWTEKDKQTWLASGVSRIVMRPVEPQRLLDEIEACLQKRKGE